MRMPGRTATGSPTTSLSFAERPQAQQPAHAGAVLNSEGTVSRGAGRLQRLIGYDSALWSGADRRPG